METTFVVCITRCRSHVPKNTVKPSRLSTGQLQLLPAFHPPPIQVVVYNRAYSLKEMGDLILRRVSHLDAFSGYPSPT